MILNNLQLEFLRKHKIPLWSILDATWMSPSEYKQFLKNTGNFVAINSNSKSPCDKWHILNLREKRWRCVECRVSSFSFMKPSETWYVYLVWSKKWKIFKIWYTLNLDDRLHHLNKDSYWWYNDWEIIYSAKYKWALGIENKIHNLLSQHWIEIEYNHYWKIIKCYELFKCEISIIIKAINKINREIWPDIISNKYIKNDYESIFNFKEDLNKEDSVKEERTNIEDDYDLYFRKYWIINIKR